MTRGWGVRLGALGGLASLLAGCVQPYGSAPGPIPLQYYSPPTTYQSLPDYRPPVSGPIPLQSAPLVQPLPPPTPAPSVTELSPADNGAIPVQDLPAPASDAPTGPATATAADPDSKPATAPEPVVRKVPTSGDGGEPRRRCCA